MCVSPTEDSPYEGHHVSYLALSIVYPRLARSVLNLKRAPTFKVSFYVDWLDFIPSQSLLLEMTKGALTCTGRQLMVEFTVSKLPDGVISGRLDFIYTL